MHKKIITAGLTLVSFSMVGGMAYAATQSVSTRPSPQVVIPATAHSDDRISATTGTTCTTLAGAGDRGRGRSVSDDGLNHDANDDRIAVTTVATTSVPRTTVPATTVADNPGRQAEPGDDRGGSGSSGPSTPATPSSSNSGKGSSSTGPSSTGPSGSGSGGSGSGTSGSGSGGSGRSGKDG